MTRAGIEAGSFSGFDTYRLRLEGPGGALHVLGTPRRDLVSAEAERLDVQLGEGRDVAQVPWAGSPLGIPESGVVDLGAGEDSLQTSTQRLVMADLARAPGLGIKGGWLSSVQSMSMDERTGWS